MKTWKTIVFIRAEGFNTPPFMAVKKVLNSECNTLQEQHTSSFKVRLLIFLLLSVSGLCYAQNYTQLPLKASTPMNVNVTINNSNDNGFESFMVTWMAEDNFRGYEIFFQMEGSRTILFFCYPDIDFNRTADVYGAIITSNILGRGKLIPQDRRWRIGVRCKGREINKDRLSSPSDIVWSEYMAMREYAGTEE